jgi:hypothetical protein
MGSYRATYCTLAAFLGWLALAGTTQAQEGGSSDEVAIRALMERINLALNADTAEKGVEIMKGVVSDKGYAIVNPHPEKPSEALVGDKKVLLEILAHSLRNGPRWGVHKVKKIVVVGPVAYEMGVTTDPSAEGKAQGDTWFNVFAKEDVGWKLVYSTPAAGLQKALRQLDARKGESAK